MRGKVQADYFFSIQPFWKNQEERRGVTRPGVYDITYFSTMDEDFKCVLGNGQMGLRMDDAKELKGYCFGVLDHVASIPQWGIQKGIFVRFAPGVFTRMFHIPSKDISAFGVPVEDVLPAERLEALRRAMALPDRTAALDELIGTWAAQAEERCRYGEESLAREVMRIIWSRQGNIRVRELSDRTGYTERYLQEVVNRQIGLSPKKLCKHVRFQKTLKLMEHSTMGHLFIAQQMGYSDQAHYCRDFKECCGLSPSEYRTIRMGNQTYME